MSNWRTVFIVAKETTLRVMNNGENIEIERWNIYNRNSDGSIGELISKNRNYGYSTKTDAERGAGKIYNHQQKVIEKYLVGQREK